MKIDYSILSLGFRQQNEITDRLVSDVNLLAAEYHDSPKKLTLRDLQNMVEQNQVLLVKDGSATLGITLMTFEYSLLFTTARVHVYWIDKDHRNSNLIRSVNEKLIQEARMKLAHQIEFACLPAKNYNWLDFTEKGPQIYRRIFEN